MSYARSVWPCVIITPLGRPVVPDVKTMSERDSPVNRRSRDRTCDRGASSPAARKFFHVSKSAGASSENTTTRSRSGRAGRGIRGRALAGRPPQGRHVRRAQEGAGDEQQACPAAAQYVRRLRALEAGVQRDEHRARRDRAEGRDDPVQGVGGPRRRPGSPASTPSARQAAAARSTRAPSSAYVILVRPSTTASARPRTARPPTAPVPGWFPTPPPWTPPAQTCTQLTPRQISCNLTSRQERGPA